MNKIKHAIHIIPTCTKKHLKYFFLKNPSMDINLILYLMVHFIKSCINHFFVVYANTF